MTEDPKEAARRKFAAGPASSVGVLDIIEAHATDPPVVVRGLLQALRPAARDGTRIAEFGFGSGWLLNRLAEEYPACELHGLDMSAGMARAAAGAAHGARIVIGDMERLPYRDGAFDAIATCWTLYFMRDIDAALEEMRRCLAPGGVFVTATVASDNMLEFEEMAQAAIREALGREPEPDIGSRFDLAKGGAYVRRHFEHVELLEWSGELVLTSVEQVLALWPNYGPQLVGEDDVRARAAFEGIARERLASSGGEIRMRRHSGAFVAVR